MNSSLESIVSHSSFIVFSQSAGVISEHKTAADAETAFAKYLRKFQEHATDSEPLILERQDNCWEVF